MILKSRLRRLATRTIRRSGLAGSRVKPLEPKRDVRDLPPPARAIEWIRTQITDSDGILVHSSHTNAYPEVSGYLVPTLLQYGERDMVVNLVRWLLCIQRADGSYTDPDRCEPHVFDTAQVLRGLLAAGELVPQAPEASRRAADYLCSQMVEGGKGGFGVRYSGSIPESVHLYALPPLHQAAEALSEPGYRLAAEQCLEYYLAQKDTLDVSDLTHFVGYELEAVIDLGRADMAKSVLEALRERQAADGSVRGVDGAPWVCTPGLAQLAICWYKAGQWEPADKALTWLEAHQQPTGGFLGSYGPMASYFPDVELSWAAKFYLDAHLLRLKSFFERNADILPSPASGKERRLQAILSVVKPNDHVLEIGCGRIPFGKGVHEAYPGSVVSVVPFSRELPRGVPEGIRILPGTPESLPCSDESIDVAFSVEGIQHSASWKSAVREMMRVTRPGGSVLIIARQPSSRGMQNYPTWESQPEPAEIRKLLNRGCDDVVAEEVGTLDRSMVVWRGRKRSRLSGPEWSKVLISRHTRRAVIERVRHNRITEWGQVVLLNTSPGERVLEVGSGTGEISLQLAQAGRIVTALDYSADSLKFIRQCARELNVPITTELADATRPLPFADSAFDCTWNSGLLEHFTSSERRSMLREWARITSGRVITLVPNAACVAYRAGKTYQEQQGTWPYGLETPILTMRGDFETAGLHVMSEYSVGARHALSFLPDGHPLHESLSAWMESIEAEELKDCNQGYLLVTIGSKRGGSDRC